MTGNDAARIESSLQVTLPAVYRDLLTSFPLPAFAGNTDTAFWDDADRLIQLNRELRSGTSGLRAWPTHMFALGRDAAGSSQAIDLRSGELWWGGRVYDARSSDPVPQVRVLAVHDTGQAVGAETDSTEMR